MKTSFQFEISIGSIKTFFPEERIKSKSKIVLILLEACRYILFNKSNKRCSSSYKLIFHKDKMSRLFFVGDFKIYSIAFPFNLEINNDTTRIKYLGNLEMDSYTISNLISLINNPAFDSHNCLDFIDPILSFSNEEQLRYWSILKGLFLIEDGYVRYDKDVIGFNEAKIKCQEHKHPLFHIDVFYSNSTTFKLGLKKEINDIDLISTLDRNTDCKYLID